MFPPVSGSASGINSLKKRQFRISSAVVHLEALRLLLRLAFADYPPSAARYSAGTATKAKPSIMIPSIT